MLNPSPESSKEVNPGPIENLFNLQGTELVSICVSIYLIYFSS